jgi:transcriptional regulator of acetoin/glycerol metabolism
MHDEPVLTEAMLQFDTRQELRQEAAQAALPSGGSLGPVERAEKEALLSALKQASGPAEKTAARLGMSRVTFFRKLKKYGLKYQI